MPIKYTVLLMGLPHHIPQAVTGRTGKAFGHATHDARFKAHSLSLTEADWNRHGEDICAGLKRRMARSFIRAEWIPDAGSPETLLLEEIDRLKVEAQAATAEHHTTAAERDALLRRVMQLENQPPQAASPVDQVAPAVPDLEHAPVVTRQVVPPLESAEVLKKLLDTPYRVLRDIAKAVNADTPDTIQLTPSPKLEVLANLLAVIPGIDTLLAKAA